MAAREQDPTGKWRKKVTQLAADLGYEWRGMYYQWEQIAMLREWHAPAKIERKHHEAAAFRDVQMIFDQRGREPD